LEAEVRLASTALEASRAKSQGAHTELLATLKQQALSQAIAMLESGQDVGKHLDAALASASQAQSQALTYKGELQAQLRRLQQDIETAKQLRKERVAVAQEHNVTADLSLMLQANRFQAFVQAHALRTLASDGTRKLLELSGGRFELEVSPGGQDFLVRDRWNDREARSVRTLSGGETFLASLALALALAEALPGLAPAKRLALESIFLDEGFGSLDAEALDRAADALDALRNENRMVCIVTHLPELAQRLPARILVTKSESGSTVAIA
jgi:exonuclease SbcC